MPTKDKRVLASSSDPDSWSDDDKRELNLVLMADELSIIAYGVVDWTRVAALGRAVVALAERSTLRSVRGS